MNMALWILQIVLAMFYFAGGAYKVSSVDALAAQVSAIPPGGWRVLGAIEILGAILLIVPAALKWRPSLTPFAAAVLALETLALAAVYAWQSVELAVTNPLVWALAMGLAVALVAYGRFVLEPPA
jgi:hypothetical protein